MPTSSSSTAPLDLGGQLDLAGGETPLAPGPTEQPPLFDTRTLGRPTTSPATVRRYHSPAWQGQVEEPALTTEEG